MKNDIDIVIISVNNIIIDGTWTQMWICCMRGDVIKSIKKRMFVEIILYNNT